MVSKCPNCGDYFKTVKGMRVHLANCKKKDPIGFKGIQKQLEKNNKKMGKIFGF